MRPPINPVAIPFVLMSGHRFLGRRMTGSDGVTLRARSFCGHIHYLGGPKYYFRGHVNIFFLFFFFFWFFSSFMEDG